MAAAPTTTKAPTRVLLGPLTTTFTPSSTCSLFVAGIEGLPNFFAGQQCLSSSNAFFPYAAAIDNTACWPSASVTPTETPFNGYGFYSPGLYCPHDYTTACAAANVNGRSSSGVVSNIPFFDFQYALTAGETAYGCCPRGMSCSQEAGPRQTCVQTTSVATANVAICTNVGLTSSTTSGAITLLAPMFQINRRSVDSSTGSTGSTGSTASTDSGSPLAIQPGPTTQSSTTNTGTSTSPTSSSVSNTITSISPTATVTANSSTDSSNGLSSNAKIGIGVGVGLGGAILLGAIVYFLLRRRARPQTASGPGLYMGDPVHTAEKYR